MYPLRRRGGVHPLATVALLLAVLASVSDAQSSNRSQEQAQVRDAAELPSRDAASAWIGMAKSGHCGATSGGDEGDCSRGHVGTWTLGTSITTWPAAVQQCLGLCGACGRCRFVSLALHLRDCSWYHSCSQIQPSTAIRARTIQTPSWLTGRAGPAFNMMG